jgi:hypothetical protein
MNQIILIGEVIDVSVLKSGDATIDLITKDYQKERISIEILIEKGYQMNMLEILRQKPLVAVKATLKTDGDKKVIQFVAEKLSVLKLSEIDDFVETTKTKTKSKKKVGKK